MTGGPKAVSMTRSLNRPTHFTVYSAHASTHVTLCLPNACLYALHSELALRMPLRISLSTFPARASMHFTFYIPCACIYAFHCLLSLRMPPCISLSAFLSAFHYLISVRMPLCVSLTFPAYASMRFTVYFPCACLYALHSALALCMPLRISLSTFLVRASPHITLYFPTHASMHFSVRSSFAHFPCARLYTCPVHAYAFHRQRSLRMQPCTSFCTSRTHASTNFTVYFPCACLYCLLSLRMPLRFTVVSPYASLRNSLCTCPLHVSMHSIVYSVHASTHCTVDFPCARIFALHSALSPRMPLCISLSTFPATPLHLPWACLYAFHYLISARMPLCISLCGLPAHASKHCALYLPWACLFAFHYLISARMPPCISLSAFLYAFHYLISVRMPLCVSLTFPAHALMRLTVYFPCACLYALHSALALRMPLRISLSTFLVRASPHITLYFPTHASMHFSVHSSFAHFPCARLYTCPVHAYAFHRQRSLCTQPCASLFTSRTHASMNFTVCFPRACLYCLLSLRMPLRFTARSPYACLYATHSALALCMSLRIPLPTLRMPLRIALSTFPAHASLYFTLHFPHVCLYAFHCLLSLPRLCTCPGHASMHFTI